MPSKLIQIPACLAMSCLAQCALAQSITVFTDSLTPLQNAPPGAVVFELDAAQRIEEQMSTGLPGNPLEAEHFIRERMQSAEWRQLEAQLKRDAEGLAKAKALGISKTPAVMVDERYVVYGIADVARALEIIEAKGGNHEAD